MNTLSKGLADFFILVALLAGASACTPPGNEPDTPAGPGPESRRPSENVIAHLDVDRARIYVSERNRGTAAQTLGAESLGADSWRIQVPNRVREQLRGTLAAESAAPAQQQAMESDRSGHARGDTETLDVKVIWLDDGIAIWDKETERFWDGTGEPPDTESIVRLHRECRCIGYENDCRGPIEDLPGFEPSPFWIRHDHDITAGYCQPGGDNICWETWHRVGDRRICRDARCKDCAPPEIDKNWMCVEL